MTEQPQKVSIAPSVAVIRGELERDCTWATALAELIDNSLDADAQNITVTLTEERAAEGCLMEIVDNGRGVARLDEMFTSGLSTPSSGASRLGRYGVGFKHASFFFAKEKGRTTVISGRDGVFSQADVCWGDVIKSGKWEIDAPRPCPTGAQSIGASSGTKIRFRLASRQLQTRQHYDAMLSELAFLFHPAIRAGRQIKFVRGAKPQVLRVPEDPIWEESETHEFVIGKKTATLRAGILSSKDRSKRQRLSYTYLHRVILADHIHGCGTYNTQGFAGLVDLKGPWKLGQNKTAVTDPDFEVLGEMILEKIAPMLERLKRAGYMAQIEGIKGLAEGVLNGVTGTNTRPGSGVRTGGPGGGGGGGGPEHTTGGNVDPTKPGKYTGKRPRPMVSVQPYNDPNTKVIGYAQSSGKSMVVFLNQACSAIADAWISDHRLIVTLAEVCIDEHQDPGSLPFSKKLSHRLFMTLSAATVVVLSAAKAS